MICMVACPGTINHAYVIYKIFATDRFPRLGLPRRLGRHGAQYCPERVTGERRIDNIDGRETVYFFVADNLAHSAATFS